MAKIIVVTGGVMSGIGKGVTSASVGMLLKRNGLKVSMQKLDPYLNVDAGTLSPEEHGECFVTDDGAETDLDIGHYERFLGHSLAQNSSLMSGKVISSVIKKEREGGYLGQTVQLVPHLTGEVERCVLESAKGSDVHIVEIGGTVGDYESLTFYEAMRSLSNSNDHKVVFMTVVYVPFLNLSNEFKTKPAQNAVKDMQQFGILPDFIVARSEDDPGEAAMKKLSLFSGLDSDRVVNLPDSKNVYEVPLKLHERRVDETLCRILGEAYRDDTDLTDWKAMTKAAETTSEMSDTKKIGLVAKYLDNGDAYKSVLEAVKFSSWSNSKRCEIVWIDSEQSKKDLEKSIAAVDGVIVPGGFGSRGLEGMVQAASYCRANNLPYLGICLGMQMAIVSAARDADIEGATSSEIDDSAKDKVIDILPGQDSEKLGGTMRLGKYDCRIAEGSKAYSIYGESLVSERHRHRYEFNNDYLDKIESWGLNPSGINPESGLVEIVEDPNHKFFVAGQFHPELKARPVKPHPLFEEFVASL